jgi:molybdopterin-containing oxidoreductase family molybdopterin binding subunit
MLKETAENATSRLTRRSFLKTTAVVAGTAALAGGFGCSTIGEEPSDSTGAEAEENRVFYNLCRGNCGGSCPLEATVREGKVVRTTPAIASPTARETQQGCVKGHTNPQRLYAAHRVLYPMKQAGERGSEDWERVTWDEAIALIAEKFQAAFDEYGPQSVAFWHSFSNYAYLGGSQSSSGMPNTTRANGGNGIAMERFLQKTGISLFTPSSDMTGLYMQFGALALSPNSQEDVANAKTVLIWGANPTDTMRGAWPFICKAHDGGAKIVTIDPQYTNSAAHSDIWLPIRGGTDSALMLAMCNYIIDNDLIDYDYMKNHSVGPLLVKEDGTYLKLSDLGLEPLAGTDPITGEPTRTDTEVVYDEASGTFGSSFAIKDPALMGSFDANGIRVQTVFNLISEAIRPFTVDFAAEECDLPKEGIEGLAELYATNKPSSICTLWGFEHLTNTYHNYKSLVLLGALTGNIGKKGASVFQLSMSSRFAPPLILNKEDLALPDAKPNRAFTGEYLAMLMDTGKWGDENFPIRCVYVMNADPLSNGIGRKALIDAFTKVDFTVVADSFLTDTARYASLVLPVTMSWECEDHNGSFMNQKAVEPAGECRNDMAIMRALSEKMGFPELYDKTDEEYLRALLDTPENLEAGWGYDDFREKGLIEDYEYAESIGAEYNPTGRSIFYLANPVPRDDYGQSFGDEVRIPWYEHATEAYKGNPLLEKYPLFAMSCHDNYQAHSTHMKLPWLDELREPYVKIHESAASARGIGNGDIVKVFNDRGFVVLKAVLTKGIRPDTVLLPHGYQESDYIEGHHQDLTLLALDPFTSNNNFNDILCQVEKYEGGTR